MVHVMDVNAILARLPHRFPFLLVDRVVEFVPGKELVGVKNVTYNEPYFVGHFPSVPIMPGVLQLEAMAQASALCHIETMSVGGVDFSNKLFLFTHVKNAKFAKPVIPGDVLFLCASVLKSGSRLAGYQCSCTVEGNVVSEAEIYASIVDQ